MGSALIPLPLEGGVRDGWAFLRTCLKAGRNFNRLSRPNPLRPDPKILLQHRQLGAKSPGQHRAKTAPPIAVCPNCHREAHFG